MGAMKAKKIEKQVSSRRVRRVEYEAADWGAVNATAIRDAIAMVSIRGGALRFGYTSDGGAFAIGVYGDGDPYTEYLRPGESAEDYLAELTEAWRTPA